MAQGNGASGAINVQPAEVNVIVVNDRQEMLRAIESNAGKRIVIQHMNNARVDFGLNT